MIAEAHSGAWSPAARQVLDRIAKMQAASGGDQEEVASLRIAQRLSIALHRATARAVLRRAMPAEAEPPMASAWDLVPDIVAGDEEVKLQSWVSFQAYVRSVPIVISAAHITGTCFAHWRRFRILWIAEASIAGVECALVLLSMSIFIAAFQGAPDRWVHTRRVGEHGAGFPRAMRAAVLSVP